MHRKMSGMDTKTQYFSTIHTVIILAAATIQFTVAVQSFHCRHSFSYHHPHLESPLDETFSHDPHHHKMWAYHHGLEVCRVVGMSGYNRDTSSFNLNVTFITWHGYNGLTIGLGGLFPNFHLLCHSHIPENTLYYSLNFPLLFPIIPEELVQLECKNSPISYTKNIQVSQQLYCIITEPST